MRVDVSRQVNGIPEGYVCLGDILAHFGLRGEVKVFLSNPESTLLNKPKKVRLMLEDGRFDDLKLSLRSGAGKKLIGRIETVMNRNDAEPFIGAKILYEAKRLPKLNASEWYHFQIIGLPVQTESGVKLGTIQEIVPGEVEIWVAENDDMQAFIPYTDDDVLSVSLTDGVIVPDFDE